MFVINVSSGQENHFVKSLNKEGFSGYAPHMTRMFRKGGRWHEKQETVFTGYVFIDLEKTDAEIYQRIKLIPNFRSFLSLTVPLPKEEERYIKVLASESGICRGEVIDGKLKMTAGPFDGVKHNVIGFSKRQRTAVIEIDLYGIPQKIKCSIEII